MIHDKPNDGSGGKAELDFSGVPVAASFLLKDDGGSTQDVYQGPFGGDAHVVWRWENCCTDGAVLGHLTGDFTIDIGALFPTTGGLSSGRINNWVFLSGSATDPVEIPLWSRSAGGAPPLITVSGAN
jgi:hypothetical protein